MYYAYFAYNANDQVVDHLVDTAITAGSCIKYPGTIAADHVDFFIKFVLRQELSVAQQFLLQVSIT
jgi:hypothetical protein